MGDIQLGVGGSSEALAAVLDTLQAHCTLQPSTPSPQSLTPMCGRLHSPSGRLQLPMCGGGCSHFIVEAVVLLQANFVVYRNTYGYFQLL